MMPSTQSDKRRDHIVSHDECPACGKSGRKVKGVTLESLVHPERHAHITEDQYYVCTTPTCDTVYFGPANERSFRKSDLTVRFGLKETDPPRHVCYCFDHTVGEIEDEIRRTGRSTVVQRIKADMSARGCRCEYVNPLGACCLQSVQAAVADALGSTSGKNEAAAATVVAHDDCCSTVATSDEPTPVTSADASRPRSAASVGGSESDRTGALAVGGSLVAAILSSACCWLPLLLIALGASAAGVAGVFEAYRPYLMAVAVGSLGFGFYRIYFRRQQCRPGSACAAPNRRLKVLGQVMLWTATALVAAFVFFPNYVGYVIGSPTPSSARTDDAALVRVEFQIAGMTCPGCANTLQGALLELPGVQAAEVDFATKTAIVRYDALEPVASDRVIEAVRAVGFSATQLPSDWSSAMTGEKGGPMKTRGSLR